MGTHVDIIRAELSDLPRVEALARAIWPEAFAGILPAERIGPMLDAIYAVETLRADVQTLGHVYWIAARGGRDIGYVSAYREGERLWIKKLYLHREARGLGLGKQLMATALAHFAGARSIGLYVNAGNAPAIGFYESQAFTVEARVPVKMGPYDFTDFIMSRPVALEG